MRLFVSVFVFCFEIAGQNGGVGKPASPSPSAGQPATTASPSAPEDLCTIQGQVMNAATGEPVKKANLSLQRTDLTPDVMSMPTSYSTSTDASGKFAMKDTEAGKYRLNVNRNGFVPTSYGARSPGRPGATLSLLRGQSVKDVVFRLTPHAVGI